MNSPRYRIWAGLGISFMAVGLSAGRAWAGELHGWHFDPQKGVLDLAVDAGVRPQVTLLSQPQRVVIDLPGTRWPRPQNRQVFSGPVRVVRVAQYSPQTTRLVLELAPTAAVTPKDVTLSPEWDHRWLVQVKPRPAGSCGKSDPGFVCLRVCD